MYESIMWQYIGEEGRCLNSLISSNNTADCLPLLQNTDALYMVAHGSSYNAATAIAPFLSRLTGIRAYAYTPSNFSYNAVSADWEDPEKTCILGISQTGTSRGVLEALQMAKDKGFKLIGITNEKDSPIDRMADATLYLNCGPEDSNAKTKGYGCTLMILMLLAVRIAEHRGMITEEMKDSIMNELCLQADHIGSVVETVKTWCERHRYGIGMKDLYVVGNGINFASAMEGQLKVMETLCIPTMFNDIEEFSHGMHRSLNSESHVLLLNTEIDEDLMLATKKYLNSKNINVLMINASVPREEDDVINVPSCPLTGSVLLIVTAIQVISAFVAEVNGYDPNRDANNDYTDCVETRV